MLAVVTTRGLGAGAAGASLYVWAADAGEAWGLGLSARLEAGAVTEAVAAWAAAVARGGEAVLGEAAAGGWAEAGSGVAAWLVHTGACSIGVLDLRKASSSGSCMYSVPVIWARMRKERDCRLEERRAHSSASSSGLFWFLITA